MRPSMEIRIYFRMRNTCNRNNQQILKEVHCTVLPAEGREFEGEEGWRQMASSSNIIRSFRGPCSPLIQFGFCISPFLFCYSSCGWQLICQPLLRSRFQSICLQLHEENVLFVFIKMEKEICYELGKWKEPMAKWKMQLLQNWGRRFKFDAPRWVH